MRAAPSARCSSAQRAARIRCPAFVVCGEPDTINPPGLSKEVAELLDAPFVILPRTGHGMAKGLVRLILLLREFVESLGESGAGAPDAETASA